MKNNFSFLSEPGIGHRDDGTINPNLTHYGINDYYDSEHETRTKFDSIEELKSKRIVLVAGDSFTFGDGVLYKDTYSNILKERFFTSDDVIVINIGYPGISNSNILQRVHMWLNVLSDNIETVIVGWSFSSRRSHFFDNDYTRNFDNSLYEIGQDNSVFKYNFNISSSLPRHTFGYDAKTVQKYMSRLNTRVNDQREFEVSLLMMKYMASFHNFKLYWWGWLLHEYHTRDRHLLIKTFSDKNSKFIDIDANVGLLERISKDDGHWTANGHHAAANIIIEYLKK